MKKFLFFLATIIMFASCQKSSTVNNNPTTDEYKKFTITIIDVEGITDDTLFHNITNDTNNALSSVRIVHEMMNVDSMRYIGTGRSVNRAVPFNLSLAYFPNSPINAISTKTSGQRYDFRNHLDVHLNFRRIDGTIWDSTMEIYTPSNHITQVEYLGQQVVTLNYHLTDRDQIQGSAGTETKSDTLDVYRINGYFTNSFGKLNSMEQRDFKVIYECPLFLKR